MLVHIYKGRWRKWQYGRNIDGEIESYYCSYQNTELGKVVEARLLLLALDGGCIMTETCDEAHYGDVPPKKRGLLHE